MPRRATLGLIGLGLAACAAEPGAVAPLPLCSPRGPEVGWFREVHDRGLDFRYRPVDFRGGPIAVFDVDGDGWLDVAAGSRAGGFALFRNLGGLRFVDVTRALGLPTTAPVSYVGHADLDGDGDEDLILAGHGETLLYEQVAGRFVLRPGALGDTGSTDHVLAVDLDRDGDLDLYLSDADLVDLDRSRNRLFENRGGLDFVEIPGAAGGASRGMTWSTTAIDRDGDGDLDLYVANDSHVLDFGDGPDRPPDRLPDALLDNAAASGPLALADRSAALGVATPKSSMDGAAVDLDGDGRLDLFVTDYGRNKAYLADGRGGFVERAAELGLDTSHRLDLGCTADSLEVRCLKVSWAAAPGDFDLDGTDDLIVVDGATSLPQVVPAPQLAYRGLPGGGFAEVDAGLGCFEAYGAIPADLDRDGDLDLLVSTRDGPLRLFENQVARGHFVSLRLRGLGGNHDGLGAVVSATLDDGSRRVRAVGAGGIVHSGPAAEVHLGLGAHRLVRLEIRWPDGRRQVVSSVPVDRLVTIDEAAP